ncbi:MAG TPA: 2-dehydro-3-deoxy-6-phosphogalactonate aldolase [Sphingomicrobium sp.]
MTPKDRFHHYLAECPLIAIIRGVTPAEAADIGKAILDAGIRMIEVPLNSPDPLQSIEILSDRFGDVALIGAGTVLNVPQVTEVQSAGGVLIVSPNVNTAVISASAAADLVSCPGYFTPSEAFAALEAGADGLKLFPAEGASPNLVKAQRAVIAKDVPLFVVGGVSPTNMQPWLDAGATGFGLGSGLYKPGQSASDTADKARAYVEGVTR